MLRIAPFLCIYLFARNVYPPMLAFLRPKDTFLPLHDKPGVSVYTGHSTFYIRLTSRYPVLRGIL